MHPEQGKACTATDDIGSSIRDRRISMDYIPATFGFVQYRENGSLPPSLPYTEFSERIGV
jgi:hypothetical protein